MGHLISEPKFKIPTPSPLLISDKSFSSKTFLTSLHWNMASLDSKGEIVPVELPNPEETQKRKGENEPAGFH